VVAVCSAADDPTTYSRETDPRKYDDLPYFLQRMWDDIDLETAIARRNIAWAEWQWQADELINQVTDGERTYYGPYNDAQKAYEHAESDLMRERSRWKANRRAAQ